MLSAAVKARLLERLPALRIVDVLGSSETGRQAVAGAEAPAPTAARAGPTFRPETRPWCCRRTAAGV